MKTILKTLPKIHLACADDGLRPTMRHILVTKDEIVASDANILVVHKTKNIFDEAFIKNMPDRFYINPIHWKQIYRKHINITFENDIIVVYRDIYPIFTESEIGTYPDYKKVLPKEEEFEAVTELGINPDYLGRLLNSMMYKDDIGGVVMKFSGASSGILVKMNNNFNEQIGLIMPVMIKEV